MRLTAESVGALKPAATRREIADDNRPGLYVVVQPSGSKSFAVRYRFGKEWRKVTLGKFGDGGLTLGESREAKKARLLRDPDSLSPCARERARAIFDRVAIGEDPAAERRGIVGATDLVKNVWTDYAARHLAEKRKATADAAKRVYKNHLSGWAEKRIGDVTKRDVLDVLDAIKAAGHPAAAIRTRAVLSKFFAWCKGRDLLRVSPCDGIESASSSAPASDRILDDAEIKKFWKACDATPYPFGPMFKLLLLTGCRREEIAALQESEIDLEARTLTLAPNRTKNGRKHAVHLSDLAMAIIENMPTVKNDAGYLFSTNGRTFATGYSKAKTALDKAMGPMPAWRLHDLRRTMVSGMARIGVALPVVERCVNHISGSFAGIVGVYQRHDFAKETAAAFGAWALHVEGVATGKPANVVPMHRPATG
jgi:integrase